MKQNSGSKHPIEVVLFRCWNKWPARPWITELNSILIGYQTRRRRVVCDFVGKQRRVLADGLGLFYMHDFNNACMQPAERQPIRVDMRLGEIPKSAHAR